MTSQPLAGRPPSRSLGPTGTLSPTSDEEVELTPLMAAAIQAKAEEEKKRAVAAWVDQQYTRCKNQRAPFERQWYLNLAFISGRQYVSPMEVPGHGFRLTAPKAPPWRVRMVANKIRPAVRIECAKLTSSKPIPTVVPATNEDEDYSAANIGEAILKAHFANAEFEETYRSWIWWGVATGISFMKQYYDPTAKDHDSMMLPQPPLIPGTDQPVPEEMIDGIEGLREYLDTPQPATGKICRERINPFHIYVPDLLAERLEAQPYLIQVMTRSPLWCKQKFNIDAHPDARATSTIMDAVTIIAKNSQEHLDSVLVKEVWIKPGAHEFFPEGGVVTIINDRVVQMLEKWPCPFPEYPFYKYGGIPTGGFYPDSTVVDLIPLQKEYNRTRSQAIEIKNTMGKPKMVYQQGSLNPKMISSEPGQSIPYKAGYQPPTPLQGVEVPQTFAQEISMLTVEFDDISGQHEISRGGTPSQVTSGTAIAFLQEQDDSKLSYQVASIEQACELLGKHLLAYIGTYWDGERVIKISGRNNTFEALHWKKGVLRGNTDVRVQTGSALPVSKAAKQAMITEWMQNGFLDPQTGMEILNMGGTEKALDDMLVDKRQAVRENIKMANIPESMLKLLMEPAPGPDGEEPEEVVDPESGEKFQVNGDGTPFTPQPVVPVNSWDNHAEHIHWHNQYRKTQEFELLSEYHKKAFELHVQTHQIALMATISNTRGQVIQPGQQQEEEAAFGEEQPEEEEEAPQENQFQ